ncbi:MAG: YdcF family protein [Burkholderiaceae bacterium]
MLPPAGPLLLACTGLLLALRFRRSGLAFAGTAILTLWLVSCHAFAIWLSIALLPPINPLSPKAIDNTRVQAIVVLGGGLAPQAPEYGSARPNAVTQSRLAYAIWLARQSGLPVGFAGGVGWASQGTGHPTEGSVARQVFAENGMPLRWVDERSRDTAENARLLARLMQADGVKRIVLVTDAWHMPRAASAFERAGFKVLAAPTGFPAARERPHLEWLPSSWGLALSRNVLREWLGLVVARWSE